ncbi:MAG: DPP IV N-terminal domain-containing protein, partial [Ignavibacteria bacterium]
MKKNILNTLLVALMLSFVSGVYAQDKEITLESIYLKPEFLPKGAGEFNSMKDGNFYSSLDDDLNINVYDYENGSLKITLMIGADFKASINNEKISIRDYKFSEDETKILISTDIQRIYRTSFVANFYIWDINTKEATKITKENKAQLAEFSPDGNKVLYISNNNIFLYDLINNSVKQITNDGKKNFIINGTSDWVYEEELGLSKAFSWSPDSKKIAFMKFDESKVKEMNLTFYGDLYPNESTYKYPKAGEDNSVVTVWIYDLNDSKTTKVDVGSNPDQYIARIKFTKNPGNLSVFRLNRLQNKLDILFADASTGKSKVVFTEENKYYISESYELTFLSD